MHARHRTVLRDPVVKPEHMTPEHRKYLNYNESEFTSWGSSVGEHTAAVYKRQPLLRRDPPLLVAVVSNAPVLFPVSGIPIAEIVDASSFLDADQGAGTGQRRPANIRKPAQGIGG